MLPSPSAFTVNMCMSGDGGPACEAGAVFCPALLQHQLSYLGGRSLCASNAAETKALTAEVWRE